MSNENSHADDYAARSKRNSIQTALWALVFAVIFVLSAWAIKYQWHASNALSVLSIVINVLIGAGMVMSYRRMITGMDELQRQIQFGAMALALGVAVVGGVVLMLMEAAGYISSALASYVVLMICLTYSAATLYGCLRYR